jgi:predicted RNA-binding Zn-ribbon protein involved in translation (DUF1610 family)
MFDGDGAETLELQAWKIAQNALNSRGSAPCPTCGVIMTPVEAMYELLCPPCKENRASRRVSGRMVY